MNKIGALFHYGINNGMNSDVWNVEIINKKATQSDSIVGNLTPFLLNSSQKMRTMYFFSLSLHHNLIIMEVKFDKDYLKELYYQGKSSDKQHRYQPDIVRRYIRVVNILDSVARVTDLYRYQSLHYEKLIGDKKGLESVRVNDQYRIEFFSTELGELTICNIVELSNHYK